LDLQGHNQELVQELVALSIRHGIVTPYTTYLADENESREQLSNSDRHIMSATERLERLKQVTGADGLLQRSNKQTLRQNSGLDGIDLAGAESASMGQMAGDISGSPAGRPSLGNTRNQPHVAGGGGLGGVGIGGGRPGEGPSGGQQGTGGVRRVGEQTLYVRGNLLVADNATDVDVSKSTDVIKLKRFSPEYFQLLEGNSDAENLLLAQQGESEELLIRLRNHVYLIQ
jgi:Ca-activated chloride channel family protein